MNQAYHFQTTLSQEYHLSYWLHLPPEYGKKPGEKWPLILFLHGAGERGSDLELVKLHGIPKIIDHQPGFPFIAVSPQCPENHWWGDFAPALIQLVTELSSQYSVDTERMYLTGLSMGGFGTWILAVHYPNTFAAIAPICGGLPWFYGGPERMAEIKHLPVWAFHGAKDRVVNPRETRQLVKALKAARGNVRMTIYPGADHDSWTETYNNPQLYSWFLSHKRH